MQFTDISGIQLEHEEEYERATLILQRLFIEFVDEHDKQPTEFYISDDEELQSILMLVCMENHYGYNRTSKETYCE